MTVTRGRADRDAGTRLVLDSFNFGGAENLIAELGRFDRPDSSCRWPVWHPRTMAAPRC
jgi:hypothetical protein